MKKPQANSLDTQASGHVCDNTNMGRSGIKLTKFLNGVAFNEAIENKLYRIKLPPLLVLSPTGIVKLFE